MNCRLIFLFVFTQTVIVFTYLARAAEETAVPQFARSGIVESMAVQTDNKILIAGSFSATNGKERFNVARINQDGTLDESFAATLSANPSVAAIALQADGKVLIGSNFDYVELGGFGLLRVNPGGSADNTFHSPQNLQSITFLHVSNEGKIIYRSGAGDLARLQANGDPDTTFHVSSSFTVLPLTAVQPDEKLLLYGPQSGMVRLNADGSTDQSFHSSLVLVDSVVVQPDGKIIVGATFFNNLSRLNVDGSLDPTFESDLDARPLAVQPDGKILVSAFAPSLIRLETNGSIDSSYNGEPQTNGTILQVITQPDGSSLCAGELSDFDDMPLSALVRLDGSGNLDDSFRPQIVQPATVYALTAQPDGTAIAAGNFFSVDQQVTAGIAVIEPDQSPSSAFRVTQLTPLGVIKSVARQSDGKILAAGELFRLDGGPSSGLLRFQVDGTIDDSFKLLPDGAVADQIAVDAEDRIVMSGFIPNSSGFGMTLARLLPDGSVDGSFSGPNPTTAPMALQLDGKIITIERICMNNCMTMIYRVARYLSDGSADSSFSGPNVTLLTGSVPFLSAIAVQPDGKVVIGGEFSLLGTTAQPNCGRLNEDGTVDDGFHPLVDSPVNTITVQGNGKIVIAGSFSSVNGVPVDGVARLNSDGSLDPTLGIPTVDGVVFASAQFTNGEIIVGGEFGVATSSANKLANISTRALVDSGDNVMMGGLIVTGVGQKNILVRAIGPSLASQGIANPLADPTLELHDENGALIASNDNWGDSSNKQAIIDSTLAPADAKEAAILTSLAVNPYTAIVQGASGSSGVGLVEAYDLDGSVGSTLLANISTRGRVLTDNNVMIGGFIVTGPIGGVPGNILIRAIGPSLVGMLDGALQDPVIELHDSTGAMIASNDNWRSTQEAAITATGLAPKDDRESAILMALAPGAYTAVVRGAGQSTGIGLVEAYNLDN